MAKAKAADVPLAEAVLAEAVRETMPAAFLPLAFPIADLSPDPRNARLHSDRNIEAVKQSLSAFKWRGVVVARKSDRVILAGHGRVEAAKQLGWTHAPVLFVPDDMALSRAYAIADNRTAELATWDWELLTKELGELDDAGEPLIGWDENDLTSLFKTTEEPQADGGFDINSVPAYDKSTDTRSVKVVGIPFEDGQRVADLLQASLSAAGFPLKVILY